MYRNIPLLYVLQALRYFLVAIPTLVVYFRSVGLSMQEILLIQAAFSATIVMFEIPSGYFSDVLGRRRTLILGSVGVALGFMVYSFSTEFWAIIIAEIILGVGTSFISGTDSAMTYDTLAALGETGRSIHAEGRQIALGNFSEAIAGVLGGALAGIALALPIYVQTGIAMLAIPVTLLLKEPPRRTLRAKAPLAEVLSIVKFAMVEQTQLRWLLVFSGVVGASTLTMVWFIQPYMLEVGVPVELFGVIWTALNFTVGWFSMSAHRIEQRLGERGMIFALGATAAAGYAALGLGMSVWALPALLLFYVVRGVNNPIFNTYINRLVPDDRRATVLSLRQLIVRVIFSIFGPLAGWISDAVSLSAALLSCAGVFALAGVCAAFPLLKRHD